MAFIKTIYFVRNTIAEFGKKIAEQGEGEWQRKFEDEFACKFKETFESDSDEFAFEDYPDACISNNWRETANHAQRLFKSMVEKKILDSALSNECKVQLKPVLDSFERGLIDREVRAYEPANGSEVFKGRVIPLGINIVETNVESIIHRLLILLIEARYIDSSSSATFTNVFKIGKAEVSSTRIHWRGTVPAFSKLMQGLYQQRILDYDFWEPVANWFYNDKYASFAMIKNIRGYGKDASNTDNSKIDSIIEQFSQRALVG